MKENLSPIAEMMPTVFAWPSAAVGTVSASGAQAESSSAKPAQSARRREWNAFIGRPCPVFVEARKIARAERRSTGRSAGPGDPALALWGFRLTVPRQL